MHECDSTGVCHQTHGSQVVLDVPVEAGEREEDLDRGVTLLVQGNDGSEIRLVRLHQHGMEEIVGE